MARDGRFLTPATGHDDWFLPFEPTDLIMPNSRIYLDNNATTCVFPEVLDCMQTHWKHAFANPGSQHSFGRDARRVLEDSREAIADILNADASEVIFTSGGTESINMAVHGLTAGRSGRIALTLGEHPATVQSCHRARMSGMQLLHLRVDERGLLREEDLDTLPWHELRLVAVILAHNETGVIQNIQQLGKLCQQHRVPLLLDAVQAVGKIPVDFLATQATALAFGAHKFHGPRGIGGLLVRRGTRLTPFLEGGHQENDRRAGTESVPLIAGMTTALQLWHRNHSERQAELASLRDRLQQLLVDTCDPVVVHGIGAERLPNTLSIAFPGLSGEALLVNLHLQEVACSLGSTCASGSAEPAAALLAMGLSRDVCLSSVRFSLSVLNTMSEIEDAAQRIQTIVHRMRNEANSLQSSGTGQKGH